MAVTSRSASRDEFCDDRRLLNRLPRRTAGAQRDLFDERLPDGYIVGPDGGFDWTGFDAEVFRFWIDEIREVGVHLLGRRLYETDVYLGDGRRGSTLGDAEIEWAALWKPLPKVVFTTTLSAVQGAARLASGGLEEEVERLRAEPGEGDIAIGGATLAAEAAALGLIGEYRVVVHPVMDWRWHSVLRPQRERRVAISNWRRDPHLELGKSSTSATAWRARRHRAPRALAPTARRLTCDHRVT